MSQQSPSSLHDLLVMKTKTLYDVEKQLVKALPKMAKAATDPELKKGFTDHLEETKEHVSRLEEIFKHLDISPSTETSDAIRGLISDAESCIENIEKGPVLDAALIAAAQDVEHLEQAGYGSAAEWANTMNHAEIQDLLGETLEEEEAADETLTSLAESKINEEANDMTQVDEPEKKQSFLGRLETGNI